jgi:hypothetical protein
MLARSILVAILVLLAPRPAAAQWRDPGFAAARTDAAPAFAGAVRVQAAQGRPAGLARRVAVGALAGAALGWGAFLYHERTTPHTDHSYDALVRFTAVSVGATLGAATGALVRAARTR